MTVSRGACGSRPAARRVDAAPGRSAASIRTSATRSRATRAPGSCCCSRRGPARATTAAAHAQRLFGSSPASHAGFWYERADDRVHEVAERQEERDQQRRLETISACVERRSPVEQDDRDEHQRREDRPALQRPPPATAARSCGRAGLAGCSRASSLFAVLRRLRRADQLRRPPRARARCPPRRRRPLLLVPLQLLRGGAAASSSPCGRLCRALTTRRLRPRPPSATTVAAEVVGEVAPVGRVEQDEVGGVARARGGRAGRRGRGRGRR